MLSIKDVEAVANNRFYEKEGKYPETAMGILFIWIIVAATILLFTVMPNWNSPSIPYATIPNNQIKPGEDVIIMSRPYFGMTVNGYFLEKAKEEISYAPLIAAVIAIGLPFLGIMVWSFVSIHRKYIFVNEFIQQWVNREIIL
jgi:hypothetical protein